MFYIILWPRVGAWYFVYGISLSFRKYDLSDVTSSVNTLDSSSRDKAQLAELCQHASQLPIFPGEDVSKQLHCSGSNGLSWIPRPEEVQVQKKAGKASRSSNGCPKRPRIAQLEDKTGPAGVDDTKDLSDKLGSYPKKCDPHGNKIFSIN